MHVSVNFPRAENLASAEAVLQLFASWTTIKESDWGAVL
jgi:hypothetical protein